MVKLIVDSTFGLESDYIKQHDIRVVNLKLMLDENVSEEGVMEDWQAFYSKLEKSKSFPKTSQPSPQDYINVFEDIFKQDPNSEILVLTISESLSGTINSARLAAQDFSAKQIAVMDSKQATVGSKILAEEVTQQINQGKNLEQLVEFVKKTQEKIDLMFVPATMEYLKRGGRIGLLSATLASVLSIKPIFAFNNGKISVRKKVLGLTKALTDMVLLLPKEIDKLYICYIHSKENLDLLVEKIKEILNLTDVKVMPVSPVFGAHVGIGAIGIACLAK